MSPPTPPSLTFAQWCERQGIPHGASTLEGSNGWWQSQLMVTGWEPNTLITACDLARVILRLPDQSGHEPLPGCKHPWDPIRVWGNGWQAESFKAGCRNHDSIHGEARAVLRFWGEPVPGEDSDPRLTRIEERLAALERSLLPQKDAPTDAELLAGLRAELGGSDWKVSDYGCGTPRVGVCRDDEFCGAPTYATLRKHGAPVVAGWLRGLAGVEA